MSAHDASSCVFLLSTATPASSASTAIPLISLSNPPLPASNVPLVWATACAPGANAKPLAELRPQPRVLLRSLLRQTPRRPLPVRAAMEPRSAATRATPRRIPFTLTPTRPTVSIALAAPLRARSRCLHPTHPRPVVPCTCSSRSRRHRKARSRRRDARAKTWAQLDPPWL